MNETIAVAAVNSDTSLRYRYYALGLLTLVYLLSYLDRQILSILLEPIKRDLALSDTQLGFLGGLAFAVFYTLFAIPMAAWSDRKSRRTLIAIVVAIWSVMTALSGLAVGFVTLLAARICVAVGESGAGPAAQSLVADYFAVHERGRAMSVFFLGVPLGILIGFLSGGWIAQNFGWRAAFFVVGLPGVAVAALVWLTLREPPRGHSEGLRADQTAPSVVETLHYLWAARSFRHIALGAALQAFVGYGSIHWIPSFLIRVHGMSVGEVGVWLALLVGVGLGVGTLLGGVLADCLSKRDMRWWLWLPALSILACAPFMAFVLLWPDRLQVLMVYAIPVMLSAFWAGPVHAIVQAIVRVRMRAMAAAVLLFVINLVGLGLGPLVIGVLSDLLLAQFGAESLRYALLVVIPAVAWSALHYWLGARTLRADLAVARN